MCIMFESTINIETNSKNISYLMKQYTSSNQEFEMDRIII